MLYKCEFCKFQTEKKTDFQRHKDRKTPCHQSQLAKREAELESKIESIVQEKLRAIAMAAPQEIMQAVAELKIQEQPVEVETEDHEEQVINGRKVDIKMLMNLNKRLHNLIRNKQGNLKSDKVHHDISRMFFYVFAQKYLDNKLGALMNLDNYKNVDEFESGFIDLLKITVLLSGENVHFGSSVVILWKKVLANNTLTKDIFNISDFFHTDMGLVRDCLTEIYKVVENVDFDALDEDIKGKIFEYYVNQYATSGSNEFGQYFTPRDIIQTAVKHIKDVWPSFTPSGIYDPCMGTAGFITEAYKAYSKSGIIECIYGNELEPETFVTARMNMLLSIKPPVFVYCQNSYLDNEPYKFPLIVTNPPFGVKADYKDIVTKCNAKRELNRNLMRGEDLYPIETNNGSALFLQHCMNKLASPGVCSIVLPSGELLGKGGAYEKIRKSLMSRFRIMSIINIPKGAFENAGVTTIVLTFASYSNLGGVAVACQTDFIDFYDYVDKKLVKLETVDPTRIKSKKYSWNYSSYKPFQLNEEIKFPYVKLGELCTIKHGDRVTKAELKEGKYPVLGGGANYMGYYNTFNITKGTITISCGGSVGQVSMADCDLFLTDNAMYLTNIKDIINPNYLYYYLKLIQEQIAGLGKGSCQLYINTSAMSEIPVALPPLQQQLFIADNCMRIMVVVKNKENENEQLKYLLENLIKNRALRIIFKYPYEKKTINDICAILPNGKRKSKEGKEEGTYPLYYCSIIGHLYMDTYDEDMTEIIINGVGDEKCKIYFAEGKHSVAGDTVRVKSANDAVINNKYLYYYLLTNKQAILPLYTGACQKHLTQTSFKEFVVCCPSLEDQLKIVQEYDETIGKLREEFQQMISNNEKGIELLNMQYKSSFT